MYEFIVELAFPILGMTRHYAPTISYFGERGQIPNGRRTQGEGRAKNQYGGRLKGRL